MAQITGFVRGGLAISKILLSSVKSTRNVKEDTLNSTSEAEKQQG
mgnify:FL=1